MRKTPFALVALGILMLAAACDRGPNEPEDRLTDREARNLMPNFLAASWRSMEKQLADHAADANLPGASFAHVEACPQAGEIRIEGTVTVGAGEAAGTRSVVMDAVKTPANCTYVEEGRTYVLGGGAPLTVRGTGTIVNGQPGSAQVSETGTFGWQIDNRSGVCSVDLAAAIDTRARIGLLTGTACRRMLNDSISWPAAAGG